MVSAFTQIGFGLFFLVAPRLPLAYAGIALTPATHSLAINLGALVVFVGAMCALALLWRRSRAGYAIAASVGALLVTMGLGHALIGVWAPVLWDGARGVVLLLTAAWLARRHKRPSNPTS